MRKKSTHNKKLRNPEPRSYVAKTDTLLSQKSDEDGVIIFQYEPQKSPWIFKKTKSLFPVTNSDVGRGCGLQL